MLSSSHLRYDFRGDTVEPSYLDDRHAPMVRTLLLHYETFLGRPYRDLGSALEDAPELQPVEPRLIAGLRRVIEESMELEAKTPVDPRRVREVVFELARTDEGLDPDSVFRAAGDRLGIPANLVPRSLYADLRTERLIHFREALPSTAAVISRYNFRLLQGLLLHAERLRVEVQGQARSVYRFAKLHGLLVELKKSSGNDALHLEITGPLSIFRHTLKYGRALACFLPACCAGGRFRLSTRLVLRGRPGDLVVTAADRVLSSHRPPRLFDSKIEKRFYQDFLRLASRWDISRESQLIPTDSGAFLPDFTFRLRQDPSVRVDLEIVGFWTRDYLERKRRLFTELSHRKIIFCVDRRLSCDDEPLRALFILFQVRVPAERVLEALEAIAKNT